ncbi:16089_t:CDS:2 [Cetraspora pellucida]|uniref:16089_t:CDS:1 n=1 Tax=Cetraspora pellucida TaxID=1433469 RepID=A0A9N9NFV9_9GLOM|nr:16089_t:CDS:2 [Cetraspora pellucida]
MKENELQFTFSAQQFDKLYEDPIIRSNSLVLETRSISTKSNRIELDKEISHGVYKEKYIYCNKEFKHAKPTKTRAYIAHECSNCPENIKQYYNYIIANNLFDDSKVKNYTIPTHLETKLFKSIDY